MSDLFSSDPFLGAPNTEFWDILDASLPAKTCLSLFTLQITINPRHCSILEADWFRGGDGGEVVSIATAYALSKAVPKKIKGKKKRVNMRDHR